MALQNFSLPFGPVSYFGVDGGAAAAAAPQYYFNEAQHAPKVFGYPESGQPAVHQPQQHQQQSGQNSHRQQHQTHYTRVTGGNDPRNGKTSIHAIVDYDDDFNDGDLSQDDFNDVKPYPLPTVTPIQGPIFIKNGSVPVVPLYSYPKVNNGSLVQIPVSAFTSSRTDTRVYGS